MPKNHLEEALALGAPYWVRVSSDGYVSIGRPFGGFILTEIGDGDTVAGAKARLDERYTKGPASP